MAQEIGTYHIADNPANFNPQRSNNFDFIITGIDSLLKAGIDKSMIDADSFIKNGQEVIRLSVNKMSVPHFTQQEIVVNRGNNKVYFAGVPEFSSGTLEVVDYIGIDGKSVLMAWQRLSYDVTNQTVGNAKDYKKDCTLIEYSPDYQMVREWELKGCWVQGLSEDSFSQESGDKRMISATIRFDRAIPHVK